MPVPSLPDVVASKSPADSKSLAASMEPVAFGVLGTDPNVVFVRSNAPFFLRHHRKNWRISTTLEDQVWLPEITHHVLQPGANGVRTRSKNEEDDAGYRDSVRNHMDKGWSYLNPMDEIAPEMLPEGVKPGGYCRALECIDPLSGVRGKRYVEAWDVPQINDDDDEAQPFTFDLAKYELWLRFLVESGQVSPPSPAVVARHIKRVNRHRDRIKPLNLDPEIRREWMSRRDAVVAAYTNAKAITKLPQGTQVPMPGEDAIAAEQAAQIVRLREIAEQAMARADDAEARLAKGAKAEEAAAAKKAKAAANKVEAAAKKAAAKKAKGTRQRKSPKPKAKT